jgi:hypothetical protein
MLPALASYISAIHKLAAIFTELSQDTNTIGDKLDNIKEKLDDNEENRARRLYKKMYGLSQKLNSCLIGTVHIFNIAATEFAALSQL